MVHAILNYIVLADAAIVRINKKLKSYRVIRVKEFQSRQNKNEIHAQL